MTRAILAVSLLSSLGMGDYEDRSQDQSREDTSVSPPPAERKEWNLRNSNYVKRLDANYDH
jgi:hypothetical protein